jgi:hypothetical protein
VLNTASPTIWGCPHIVTLEERFVKTKSSMVASTIPKALFVTEIGMLPASTTAFEGIKKDPLYWIYHTSKHGGMYK